MCGRFSLVADLTTVAQQFGVPTPTAESVAWIPHYNIAPMKTVVVVGDDWSRHLTQMRWGLIPSWAKDPTISNRMIDARAETVAVKPAFRVALRKRRSLSRPGFTRQLFQLLVEPALELVLSNGEGAGTYQRLTSSVFSQISVGVTNVK